MNLTIENVFYIISLGSFILFIGAWYGSTKKKLAEIEIDLKEVKNDKFDIIDKLARIETKLDYLNKEK
jgi:hypothetical protein